jgi:hypothetical protein
MKVETPLTKREAFMALWREQVERSPQVFKTPIIGESGCNHEFKEYVGLTESYKYCLKCDHKEPK